MAGVTFDVDGYGSYFYDGVTNKIWTLEENAEIPDEMFSRQLSSIQWKTKLGEDREIKPHSLILQITRNCNLRCSYCAYSGKFNGMLPHAEEDMPLETIRSSIDFYLRCCDDAEEHAIVFYGGEALLRFDLITQAVDYADSLCGDIKYSISSNGVAVDKQVVEWLEQHPNVSVNITVNGEKHDVYRRTVNDKGSLQIVMNNINYIKENKPQVWDKQIRFIANTASRSETERLLSFYKENIGKPPALITSISMEGCDDEALKQQFIHSMSEEDQGASFRLKEAFLQSDDPYSGVVYEKFMNILHNRGTVHEGFPGIISSCSPITARLFVRTDGTFNVCEKVVDSLCLGNVDTGFDVDEVQRLFIEMQAFAQRNCIGCWAQRLCMYCFQDVIAEDGSFRESFSAEWCDRSKKSILEQLKLYVQTVIRNPARLDDGQNDV